MADPVDTSASVEEPAVKPADDGGAPAPSDGSTSDEGAPDPLAAPAGTPPAPQSAGRSGPPGPPTDPGTSETG